MNGEKKFRDMRKSNTDKKIAGVCGGLGEYTPLVSWMWRVVFLLALCLGGLGFFVYIVFWICMPEAE